MHRAYLGSNMLYSFWFQPSSRQYPAFEMYICGVLFVCLFIVFACELVWNVLVNQKGFLYLIQAMQVVIINRNPYNKKEIHLLCLYIIL